MRPPQKTMPATSPSHNISYFPAASHEETRQQLGSVVAHSSGIAILLGGVGVGKTFLLDVIAADLVAHGLSSHCIAAGRCRNSDELLELVLFEVGVNAPATSALTSALSRRRQLREVMEKGATPSVLFLDEVDGFSPEMLDEVRAWSDWHCGSLPAVRCVLAGTLAFDETLTHPKLAAFSQRIAARCYLEPFLSHETRAFLNRLSGGDIWSDMATTLVHRLTDGVPRLVAQLTAHIGVARNGATTPVTAAEIQAAWQRIEAICSQPPVCFGAPDSIDSTPLHVVHSSFHEDCDDINDDLAGAACVEFGAEVETVDAVDEGDTVCAVVPLAAAPVAVPAYVYQTTEPVVPQYPCYIDKDIAMLNWVAPGHRVTSGYATPYRASSVPTATLEPRSVADPSTSAARFGTVDPSKSAVRFGIAEPSMTSLDETFAESIRVTLDATLSSPETSIRAPAEQASLPTLPVSPVLALVVPEPNETVHARLETAIVSLQKVVEQLHTSGGQMERVVERAAERAAVAVEQRVERLIEESVTPPIHELIEMIVDFESALHQDNAAIRRPYSEAITFHGVDQDGDATSERQTLSGVLTQFDDLLDSDPTETLGRLVGDGNCAPSRRSPRSGTTLPLTAPPILRGTTSRGVPAIRLFQDDPQRRVDLDSLFQPPRPK